MGAGAIGGYVGGRLALSGRAEVTMVGRKRLADAVRERGLVIREFDREDRVEPQGLRIVEDPNALSSCDVVFCSVKSGATEQAADALSTALPPSTVVVSLQNGIRNPGVLRKAMPNNPVVPAVVSFNVIVRDEATFHLTTDGPLMVETRPGGEDQAWVDALRAADLEIDEVRPLEPELWTKLLVNLNNAVSALSDAPTRDMILSPKYRRVIAMLLDEALAVLRAAGIQPAKFRGVPLKAMSFIMKLPTPIVRLVVRAQLRVDPEARASMWSDLERRRPTEVDFLNGEIVRLAEQQGLAAPRNRRIVELVHEAERAAAGSPRMSAETLLHLLDQK